MIHENTSNISFISYTKKTGENSSLPWLGLAWLALSPPIGVYFEKVK